MNVEKLIKTSGIYGLLALISGVFYREYTKAYAFTGHTVLSLAHVHLMVLGMIMFMILALFAMQSKDMVQTKSFKKFNVFYNIGLVMSVVMFYVRGIMQVQGVEFTKAMNGAIAGISGIGHILLFVGMIYLYKLLMNIAKTH